MCSKYGLGTHTSPVSLLVTVLNDLTNQIKVLVLIVGRGAGRRERGYEGMSVEKQLVRSWFLSQTMQKTWLQPFLIMHFGILESWVVG